jgi:DNA polymerase-1
MNHNGILVDQAHFAQLGVHIRQLKGECQGRIRAQVGRDLNPVSGDQVAALLFDELGLGHGLMRLTPTGSRESTDQDILEGLRGQHSVVGDILEYRELNTLENVFVVKLPMMVGRDGRLRTRLKSTTARNGRLASEDPNLQNIPIRTELGREIRAGFIASPGHKIVGRDLSQIEMREVAHLSQDPKLVQVFFDGRDIHQATAAGLGSKPEDQVTPDERYAAKHLGFAVLYLITAKGLQLRLLAEGIVKTEEECQAYINGWFALYSGVQDLIEQYFSRARRYMLNWDEFGRHRFVPEAKSVHRGVANRGLREAANHPISAGAAGLIKVVMYELRGLVEYFGRYPSETCLPLLQIHDEVLFECSDPIVDDFLGMAGAIMETAVPLSVPVESSGGAAQSWGALEK